jgi:non-ribosomal peptide synthetase component F
VSSTSIAALVQDAGAKYADAEAVVDGDRRVSFAELASLVRRGAAFCLACGVQPGDRVAVWAPNSLGWIPASKLGADQLGFPVKFAGEDLPVPAKAPEVGEHTYEVLRACCDYDDATVADLRRAGAFGSKK